MVEGNWKLVVVGGELFSLASGMDGGVGFATDDIGTRPCQYSGHNRHHLLMPVGPSDSDKLCSLSLQTIEIDLLYLLKRRISYHSQQQNRINAVCQTSTIRI